MLVNKDFLTWLLIVWRLCHQPIRCQVWKYLLTNIPLVYNDLFSTYHKQMKAWVEINRSPCRHVYVILEASITQISSTFHDTSSANLQLVTIFEITPWSSRKGLYCQLMVPTRSLLLYPPYPKDRGMLWFYVEAARRPPPAARNGVNAITRKPRDGLLSNLVYT